MTNLENNAYFWQKIDTLFFSSKCVISRPSGTTHPQYSNLIYPVDYGYLQDTLNSGQEGIDVYKGSKSVWFISTLVIAVDILKRDVEVKLLVGCTPQEEDTILRFLNQTDFQKTILVRRGVEIPSWGNSDL